MLKKDKYYYEPLSKFVLEKKFSKFNNLTIFDRPDLLGCNVGIEVTRAVLESDAKFISFFNQYENKYYNDIPQKKLLSLGFQGAPIKENIILYYQKNSTGIKIYYLFDKRNNSLKLIGYFSKFSDFSFCIENICKSINNKLEKLNDGYEIQNENDLSVIIDEQLKYIFAETIIIDDLLNKIILNVKNLYNNSSYTYYFDYIYLVFLDKVIEINTNCWTYSHYDLTQNDWNDFKNSLVYKTT